MRGIIAPLFGRVRVPPIRAFLVTFRLASTRRTDSPVFLPMAAGFRRSVARPQSVPRRCQAYL